MDLQFVAFVSSALTFSAVLAVRDWVSCRCNFFYAFSVTVLHYSDSNIECVSGDKTQ